MKTEKEKIILVEIALIKTHGLQTRVELSNDTIKEYVEAIEGGAVFPPVSVYFDGKDYWLADGFHRLEAMRRIGQKKIRCVVKGGTRIDALRCSLGANSAHGLRRTNADKQNAVRMAYESRIALGLGENPAANAVAKMCGVSQPTAVDQLKNFLSWADAEKRVGSDGRTRSMPPSRTPKPVPQSSGDVPVAVSKHLPVPRPIPQPSKPFSLPVSQPARIKPADLPTDDFGIAVPPSRLDAWNRRHELKELANQIQAIRRAIETAQDSKDPIFAEVNFSTALPNLDRVKEELAKSVPWCVCPMCQGHEGCKTCKGSGLLSKFAYDKFVPQEFKRKSANS